MQACVVGLALFMGLFLGIGGSNSDATDPDGVALFKKDELAKFNEESCNEKQPKRRPHLNILCESAWLPFAGQTTEQADEVYWLFRVKPGQKPIIVRVASYRDGSGALWVTTFVKNTTSAKREAKAQVADLSAADLATILPRIHSSEYWTLERSLPGLTVDRRVQDPPNCNSDPAWILEGRRGEDYRVVAVHSCTHAKWVLNLNNDILALAHAKIPNLSE